MRETLPFKFLLAGAVGVLAAGFLAPLASGVMASVLWVGMAMLSVVLVIMAARTVGQLQGATRGAAIGFVIALLWWEGRWLSYLIGWGGLEMDRFLSALGEMPISAGGAQLLTLLVASLWGLVFAACGAVIGSFAGGERPTPSNRS
jgi:hypothetical protein